MTATTAGIAVPAPGRAVLACRCGRMLALADMHRPVRNEPRAPGSPSVIEPIRCEHCATTSAR